MPMPMDESRRAVEHSLGKLIAQRVHGLVLACEESSNSSKLSP